MRDICHQCLAAVCHRALPVCLSQNKILEHEPEVSCSYRTLVRASVDMLLFTDHLVLQRKLEHSKDTGPLICAHYDKFNTIVEN